MINAIELTKQLISQPSVTPNDAGCQDILIQHLEKIGFQIERLPFADVSNFWARFGTQKPLLVFAGHTDVVPPGPLEEWTTPPFQPEIRDGYLYGRGAADMKSGLAAMVCACEKFLAQNPNPPFSIAFLITSDEEGTAINGTKKVIDYLQQKNEQITWCIVGEPSSHKNTGDTIKIGRRGSLHGFLKVFGKQGHIAYPDLAENPIHKSFKALQSLTEQSWDIKPNHHFPPTSMQISNIHGGLGTDNVIPGELDIMFNFRFSTATTAEHLQQVVEAILDQHQLKYRLDWRLSGKPFLTSQGQLLSAVEKAIETTTGKKTERSTSGGTSDGRFIAPTGAEVIEIGLCNATIHQIDECVAVADIEKLADIYANVLRELTHCC